MLISLVFSSRSTNEGIQVSITDCSTIAMHWPNVTIKSGENVWVTHVHDYRAVYVRAAANDDAFYTMAKDVNTAAETAPSLETYPLAKDFVLAPYDAAYYRGIVLSTNENTGSVRVGYIDWGNTQEVPFTTLRVLPTELKVRPKFTIMV